jgi:hypothetical protein
MNKKEVIEAILFQLKELRKEGCDCVYFDALSVWQPDDNEDQTFGDLIDDLIARDTM